MSFFEANYSTRRTWNIANFFQVQAAEFGEVQLSLRFRFDNRILTLSSALVVTEAGAARRVLPTSSRIDVSGPTSSVSYDFTLGSADGLARGKVQVPISGFPLYPQDNIEGTTAPTVEVVSTNLDGIARNHGTYPLALSRSTTDVVPWAVEIHPVWEAVSWDAKAARTYRAPTIINVRSMGPNPSPPGSAFLLDLASTAFVSAPFLSQVLDESGNDVTDRSSLSCSTSFDRQLATITILDSLAPGSSRRIILEYAPTTLPSSVPTAPGGAVVLIEAVQSSSNPRRQLGAAENKRDETITPELVAADITRRAG